MKYLIIGSGSAGLSAAETIRNYDQKAHIQVVSQEYQAHYIKPVLVDYIAGKLTDQAVRGQSELLVKTPNLDFKLGRRALKIHPRSNTLLLSDGEELEYNFLLLAAGARMQLAEILQTHREKILLVENLTQAKRIRTILQQIKAQKSEIRAVVIGGGYIAIELLRMLYSHQIKTTLLSDHENFWNYDIPTLNAEIVKETLEKHSVKIYLNLIIKDLLDFNGQTYHILTDNSEAIPAELIFYAGSRIPDLTLAATADLHTEKGIIVGADMRSSVSNIFAAGDAAQVYDLNRKINRLNFGWLSAQAQGEIAAKNMVGRSDVFIPDSSTHFQQLFGKKLLERW